VIGWPGDRTTETSVAPTDHPLLARPGTITCPPTGAGLLTRPRSPSPAHGPPPWTTIAVRCRAVVGYPMEERHRPDHVARRSSGPPPSHRPPDRPVHRGAV